VSSDMEQELTILESMPLRKIEKLTLQVDALRHSGGQWSTETLSVQKLIYVSGLMQLVERLKLIWMGHRNRNRNSRNCY
jgi:hypothetical protein